MKPEQQPRCHSCGTRHAWLGKCPEEPSERGALTGPFAALALVLLVCLFCGLSQHCGGAVVAYDRTFTATAPFEFSLDPTLKSDVLFYLDDESRWTVGCNYAHNKNARFHAYEGILATMLPGWETFFDLWPHEAVMSGLWWKHDGTPVYIAMFSNPEDDGAEENYHHGWVSLSVNPDNSLTIYGWAYEAEAAKPITIPESDFAFLAVTSILCIRRNRKP